MGSPPFSSEMLMSDLDYICQAACVCSSFHLLSDVRFSSVVKV